MMFNLAYHLKWGYDDLHEMPMADLYRFHGLLERQLEAERDASQKAAKK